jgi:uncharacterized protein (UPF0332 family)
VTPEIAALLQVARPHLAEAAHKLRVADRPNAAARNAYLGALAAARAVIVTRTGRISKTHTGTRSEISRLAHIDPRIDRDFARFLSVGFELKSWADYGEGRPHVLTLEAAAGQIAEASRLIAHAEWLLSQPDSPPPA